MFVINKQRCIFVTNKHAMIRKEDLRQIVLQQKEILEARERTIQRSPPEMPDLKTRQTLIITGVRRCGKSTLMRQMIRRLGRCYFRSFEDIRLTGFEPGDFEKIDQVFPEVYGRCKYYCFDEIQNVKGWELYVRTLLDGKNRVIITGSNARLLSGELGTHLTGRHIDHELFPFSYFEFLEFTRKKNSMASLKAYMNLGGFPEYLMNRRPDYLQNLLSDILIRDIAVRYGIRNINILKEMALYLLSNVGKEFSYHSLRKMFGMGAVSTVIEYIGMFQECYLMFTVPRFDYSLKKQSYHPKKVYAIDNGLVIANSLSFSKDTGRMLENLVYNVLRQKFRDIYYFREHGECDFIVADRGTVTMAVQVCSMLTADNKRREIDGLFRAMEFFGLKEGYFLTMHEEDNLTREGRTIFLKPVWEWIKH